MTAPTLRRLYHLAAAVAMAAVATEWLRRWLLARRTPLLFDDSYMFLRYAGNVRHGLGYAWNPDGVHTYGPTSLLWSGCTLLLSYLPLNAWDKLIAGSGLCSLLAVVAMAWAVAANAGGSPLARTGRVLPLVAVPMLWAKVFSGNQFTGMETMLAMTLCGLFTGLALRWVQGQVHPALPGAVAFLLVLARPESALLGLLMPLLLWLLSPGQRPPLRRLAGLYAVFLGLLVVQLLLCRLYFGTALPLSVYMKGRQAYLGYRGVWHPELILPTFLSGAGVFLAAWLLLARRADRQLLLACGLPLLLVFTYLQTVTQIMGWNARYYAPYLPLVVVPALLLLVRRIQDGDLPPPPALRRRAAATGAMFLALLLLSSEAVQAKVRHAEHRARDEYDAPVLQVDAAAPLPSMEWHPTMLAVTDQLVAPLPRGVTVAATEVGYLGAHAPQVNIIDLAGLNDTDIALHGFHMDRLLARRPDLIWMPHADYTYQRGVMFGDPRLLQQYDLYAGAANYGLAVRKQSPFRAAIERQLALFWAGTYPGTTPAAYQVHAASWSRAKRVVYGE